MTDMGTFERELSEQLEDEASRIDPDVAAARRRLDTRLSTSTDGLGPQRSPFLAVAAAATVIAGGALAYQLRDPGVGQIDATNTSVLSETPEPTTLDEESVTTTEELNTDEGGSSDEPVEDSTSTLDQAGLDWDQIPAPTIDRSLLNAVWVDATQTEPGDPDGELTTSLAVWTDDGRSLAPGVDGGLVELPYARLLSAVATERSNSADDAVTTLLLTSGLNPATATRNTIETRTWALSVTLLTSGNLEPDQWHDVMRLLSTIEGVEFFDQAGSEGRVVMVRADERPGSEVWTLRIDGDSGAPISLVATNRDGNVSRLTEYAAKRVEVPPATPSESVADEEQVVSLAESGIRLTGADTGEQATIDLGGQHDDVVAALDAWLGVAVDEPATCPSGIDPTRNLTAVTWPGLRTFADADGTFVGWRLTGNETVTTYTGLGVGSTVSDLQAVYPGLVLEMGPLGPSAFIDPIVYIASSENSSSKLTHVLAGDVCLLELAIDEPNTTDTPVDPAIGEEDGE